MVNSAWQRNIQPVGKGKSSAKKWFSSPILYLIPGEYSMVLLRFRLQDKPTNQPTWCHMDWWWVVWLLVEGWKWSGHKYEQVGRSCDVGLKKHTCCFLDSSAFYFAKNRHFCGSLGTPNRDGLTVWPQTESTPSRRNSQLWRRSCEQHWPLNRNGADGWWLIFPAFLWLWLAGGSSMSQMAQDRTRALEAIAHSADENQRRLNMVQIWR